MIKLLKAKVKNLDEHTIEVLTKSSASLIIRVVGMISTFALSILLGRTIGAEGLGIINLCNRVVAIGLVIAMLGMNNVLLKEIAIAYENKDWQMVGDSIHTSKWINLPLSIFITFTLLIISPWLSDNVFKDPKLEIPLMIAVSIIPFQVFSKILVSGINGWRKVWQSNLFNETLSVIITVLGLNIAYLKGVEITVYFVAGLYAFGRIFAAFVVWKYWRKLFRIKVKPVLKMQSMLKVALPLLIVSATTLIASNSDAIMLGWLKNSSEVGFYSVASQLGLLSNFFLVISISTLSPKIASLYANNKIIDLELMVQRITLGLIFLSLLSFLFFVFFGHYVLSFWGSQFTTAYSVLIIIAIGQLFNISTGCTGVLLIMTGHEKTIGYITLTSAVTNILLNLLLIPKFGGIGAAIATSCTVILENLIKVIIVKIKLGIYTVPIKLIRI